MTPDANVCALCAAEVHPIEHVDEDGGRLWSWTCECGAEAEVDDRPPTLDDLRAGRVGRYVVDGDIGPLLRLIAGVTP